jgi:hypothetical protein
VQCSSAVQCSAVAQCSSAVQCRWGSTLRQGAAGPRPPRCRRSGRALQGSAVQCSAPEARVAWAGRPPSGRRPPPRPAAGPPPSSTGLGSTNRICPSRGLYWSVAQIGFVSHQQHQHQLQHLQPTPGDPVLQARQVGRVERVPLGPDVRVLKHGGVPGAGHVGQHAVELEGGEGPVGAEGEEQVRLDLQHQGAVASRPAENRIC